MLLAALIFFVFVQYYCNITFYNISFPWFLTLISLQTARSQWAHEISSHSITTQCSWEM